jgi:hypothetical protein
MMVVVVLGLHVQHGVNGGLVRLVRRRPLLPTARSLLGGPDRTAKEKINDDEIAVVVVLLAVVGKLRRKGNGEDGGGLVQVLLVESRGPHHPQTNTKQGCC